MPRDLERALHAFELSATGSRERSMLAELRAPNPDLGALRLRARAAYYAARDKGRRHDAAQWAALEGALLRAEDAARWP